MFILLLVLTSCTTAEGTWSGTCTNSGYSMDAVLDISDDQGGDLTGDFTLSKSGDTVTMSGTGTRDGMDVDMDMDLTASGYTNTTTFSGTMDGNDMSGTWGYSFSGLSVSTSCDLARE